MMVFWQARLVILANPKTGSQALEAALGPAADFVIRHPPFYRHMPLTWYRQALRNLFLPEHKDRFETLAVVREPVSWLGSWYRYRLRDDIAGQPGSTRGHSFDAFVEGWLAEPQPAYAALGRQARFCALKSGKMGIDHLFAYEAPEALTGFLEDRLCRPIELPRVNVSPQADTPLSAPLRQRLATEAAEEFELHARASDRAGRIPG